MTKPAVGAWRVLVVDDSPVVLVLIQTMLERAQYLVETAGDAEEGLEKARRRPPHVVITDNLMPGMSGQWLLESLREGPTTQHIPVIMLTSSTGDAASTTPRPDAVVSKADGLERLLSSLTDIIGRFEFSSS